MDFGNPWMIVSSLIIGAVGMVIFNHGRKEVSPRALATGVVLCVYPYFVASLLVLWLVFAAVVGGLYVWQKMGGATSCSRA